MLPNRLLSSVARILLLAVFTAVTGGGIAYASSHTPQSMTPLESSNHHTIKSPMHPLVCTTCASCPSDTYCDGANPATQGCITGSYTVPGGTAYIHVIDPDDGTVYLVAEVDLEYSPTCESNWGLVTFIGSGVTGLMWISVVRSDGVGFTAIISPAVHSSNGEMVYSPTLASRACGIVSTVTNYGACTKSI